MSAAEPTRSAEIARAHTCPDHGLPMVLDAFAGEGGATAGLMRAGFCVTAVDNDPNRLKNNPAHHKVCTDAIGYILTHGDSFEWIWTSPTCTGYSRGTVAIPDRIAKYDRQIAATRAALEGTGRPWVIENVEDTVRLDELRADLLLCGRMFGLGANDLDGEPLVLDRHRAFEVTFPISQPSHPQHGDEQVAGAYGGGRRATRRPGETIVDLAARDRYAAKHERKGGYVPRDPGVLEQMLGVDWLMTVKGLYLCIPPTYSEYIARAFQAWQGAMRNQFRDQYERAVARLNAPTTARERLVMTRPLITSSAQTIPPSSTDAGGRDE